MCVCVDRVEATCHHARLEILAMEGEGVDSDLIAVPVTLARRDGLDCAVCHNLVPVKNMYVC